MATEFLVERLAIQELGRAAVGRELISRYAYCGHRRLESPRLAVDLAGIALDNPVMLGAGWDKKFKTMKGIYALGFAGSEDGGVSLYEQPGWDRPRMWFIDDDGTVLINRLGFNNKGAEKTQKILKKAGDIPGVLGANITINKYTDAEEAPRALAKVIPFIYDHVKFVTVAISSPNTENIRSLQRREPLSDIIDALHEEMDRLGERKPIFVKHDGDQSWRLFDELIETALAKKVGLVGINTTINPDIKGKYGKRWHSQPGGLSGADPEYQQKARDFCKYAYEQAGDELVYVSCGGIDSGEEAWRRMELGATAVQVVTAMKPSYLRIAAKVNTYIDNRLQNEGVENVRYIIGRDTDRGPKYTLAA